MCILAPTYAPDSLRALGDVWIAKGGQNLGMVGNNTHRAGYHLGKARIYAHRADDGLSAGVNPDGSCADGQGAKDYSVQMPRDRNPTNAAMAIDLAGDEVPFAKWLIGQCQAGAPDTRDIRAVNYQTFRWDRINGQGSAVFRHSVDETGHVHIEFFRDSETHDLAQAAKRYLGGDMASVIPITSTPKLIDIASGAGIYALDGVTLQKRLPAAITDRLSPYGTALNGTSFRVIDITIDGTIQLALVKASDTTQRAVPDSFAEGFAAAKTKATSAVSNIS